MGRGVTPPGEMLNWGGTEESAGAGPAYPWVHARSVLFRSSLSMPVKVRCPGCQKVLTAPDAARGKSLKCPECTTAVKIPAGEGAGGAEGSGAKAKAKPKTVEDDEGLLSRLDMSAAMDTGSSLCPKCGTDIPEEAKECPKCGVDPLTGQLSKAAKRRKGLKGVDPREFYKVFLKDSWQFTLENWGMLLRTAWYMLFSLAISGGCGFMVGWCSRTPPKAFWGFLGTLAYLTVPGWWWYQQLEIIKLTTVKKTSTKDIKFDLFYSVAMGLTFIAWIISHAIFPPALFCLPIALIHLAMPVSWKGWVFPITLKLGLKHFPAVALYLLTSLILGLPMSLLSTGMQLVVTPQIPQAIQQKDFRALTPLAQGLLVASLLLTPFLYAFHTLFMARVNGLIALYFRDTLELVTVVAEKAYKRKEVKVDKFGNPIKTPLQKYGPLVFALLGIVLAGNVITYFATGGRHVMMPDSLARALGILQ